MADNGLNNFNFSFSYAQNARKELQEIHSSLNDRISNIVDSEKFFINGFPVIKNLVHLNPSKSDLKRLSKALDRLGDLMEAFQEIDKKLTTMTTLSEDPSWFAWACGDFAQEIDQGLESLLNNKE